MLSVMDFLFQGQSQLNVPAFLQIHLNHGVQYPFLFSTFRQHCSSHKCVKTLRCLIKRCRYKSSMQSHHYHQFWIVELRCAISLLRASPILKYTQTRSQSSDCHRYAIWVWQGFPGNLGSYIELFWRYFWKQAFFKNKYIERIGPNSSTQG